MKIAYFDCFAGISGDMILGALIDAGLEIEHLKKDLALLNLEGYSLELEKVSKNGINGSKITVHTEETNVHRHLSDIKNIIQSSGLGDAVKEKSIAIFTSLAKAEAKIHGTTPEKIHFHEVGAMDAIIDIVGAVIGLERMGIKEVYSSSLRTGTGFVKCAHGILPVPAPATLELLKGVPIYGGEIEKELVTPTGAAILTNYAKEYGNLPSMQILNSGYGAGSWDLPIPNLLRLIIGEKQTKETDEGERFGGTGNIGATTGMMIEVNLDDLNPEYYDYLMESLFNLGAWDVAFSPLQMKKNRPATLLKVLLPPEKLEQGISLIFKETTTIGLRVYSVEKYMLPYETLIIKGDWGPQVARVKLSRFNDKINSFSPEYEDCRKIAGEQGIPLKEVYLRVKMETLKILEGKT